MSFKSQPEIKGNTNRNIILRYYELVCLNNKQIYYPDWCIQYCSSGEIKLNELNVIYDMNMVRIRRRDASKLFQKLQKTFSRVSNLFATKIIENILKLFSIDMESGIFVANKFGSIELLEKKM